MTRLLLVLALVGCGQVASGAGPDGGGTPPGGDGGSSPGSAGSFVWQKNLFGSFPDVVTVVGEQLYVGASDFSALDLGKGIMVPAGGTDLLYARYSLDGALASAWQHGGASSEDVTGFSIDPSGNASIAVLYDNTGTANIGGANLPAVTTGGLFEGVAASYTDAGTLRWQTPITGNGAAAGNTGPAFPRSASTNATGLTLVSGSFSGTLTIGATQLTSRGADDAFYAIFDANGNLSSALSFGGATEDQSFAAIFDPIGTIVIAGTFTGKVSFGSFALDAGGGTSAFVVRMTTSGQVMWAVQGGGTSTTVTGLVAATTPNGDIIIAAGYTGSFQLTGGASVSSAGSSDIALARISSAGKVAWTKSFGGAGPDQPRALAVGLTGDIALSAEFEAQASFGGATFTALGGQDAAIAKYSGDGTHLWSHAYGSAGVDRGLGIGMDSTGAVYGTVSYHGTIDFGGGPLTASGTDYAGVLIKFSP